MAKIYTYAGIAFFLYTDDHTPIHVHVRYQGNEFRALITYGPRGGITNVEWKRVKGKMTMQIKAKAEEVIRARSRDIMKKWTDIHVLNKHVKPITILRIK